MKNWIRAFVFLFSIQAFSAWAEEYKVVDIYDQGGKKLQPILTKHAKEGWVLKEIVYRHKKGSMMLIFEK